MDGKRTKPYPRPPDIASTPLLCNSRSDLALTENSAIATIIGTSGIRMPAMMLAMCMYLIFLNDRARYGNPTFQKRVAQ